MKPTTTTLTALLLTTSTLAISNTATYKLAINPTTNPALNTTLVLKDESAPASFPNILGSFSTGEPRYPYTFTIKTNSSTKGLYEFNGAVRKTHLVLNGDSRALGLFDVAIGADPKPVGKEQETRSLFMISPSNGVRVAAPFEKPSGGFENPGSWRACTNGTVDYQIYWYDGLSNLQSIIPGCEAVTMSLVEVSDASSTARTKVPSPTASGFLTGVGAPSQTPTASGWITGVPAPSGNATITGVPLPSQFPGAAPKVGLASALMGLAVAAGAMVVL